MCGIAGFYVRKPIQGLRADKLVSTLLDEIDWRGGEATGMALFGDDGLLQHQRAGCDAKTFNLYREWVPTHTRMALLHTRLATQGHPAFVENNHPVESQGVYVVHNGHISNDGDIWAEIGHAKRQANVDSEAIPAWIAQNGWENAIKSLEKFEGSMAIAAAHAEFPGELLLAKGEQSPLFYAYTDHILVWASTEPALLKAWGGCIGTPPKSARVRQLKLGDWLLLKDGEISQGKFTVAMDWTREWAKYNTTGKGVSSDGWTVTTFDSKGKKSKTTVSNAKTVDEWLAERNAEELEKANVNELQEEFNTARARTEEIMKMPEGWWRNEEILNEFNDLWDRIRVLRELMENAAWAAFESGQVDDEEEGTEIQCPGCYNNFPIGEMQELPHSAGTDALYCWDCYDEWEFPTITRQTPTVGELVWKTIAPGTEVMVQVDENGEEIES